MLRVSDLDVRIEAFAWLRDNGLFVCLPRRRLLQGLGISSNHHPATTREASFLELSPVDRPLEYL